jgi:hypothetical protein
MSSKTMPLAIDYHNMDPSLQKVVTHMMEKVAKIAYRNGGVIFGGYVRDVIIPRVLLKAKESSFKDVDLWFRTQEEADQFVCEANNYLRKSDYFVSDSYYKFSREVYDVIALDVHIGMIDVIVSKEYPVDDFDVNSFSYDGENIWYNGRGNIGDTLTNIHQKQAVITRDYAMTLLTNGRHRVRVTNRYLGRGWEICAGSQIWLPSGASVGDKELKSLQTKMTITSKELNDWTEQQTPIRHEVVEQI